MHLKSANDCFNYYAVLSIGKKPYGEASYSSPSVKKSSYLHGLDFSSLKFKPLSTSKYLTRNFNYPILGSSPLLVP